MRLADEVALVTGVQSGLLDALPLSSVAAFRRGLPDALDRGAPEAVRMLQETGALDDAARRALQDAIRNYVRTLAPPAAAPAP